MFISRKAEDVRVIVQTGFASVICAVADSGADFLEAVGLHGDSLSGTTNENAETVLIRANVFSDSLGVIIKIILGIKILRSTIDNFDTERS